MLLLNYNSTADTAKSIDTVKERRNIFEMRYMLNNIHVTPSFCCNTHSFSKPWLVWLYYKSEQTKSNYDYY